MPAGGAVTGWAALRLHGAGYFDGRSADGAQLPVPLVVPPGIRLREMPGTTVHRERLSDDERSRPHGIAATTPARACFDASRRAVDLTRAVVALDMTLAAGLVSVPDLRAFVVAKDGWSGVTQVRKAIELADARCMSPQETSLRLIWVLGAGLPAPRCNWPVADGSGRFIGRPDLLSTELAVVGEFDGAHHRNRTRHRDDLRRDDAFRAVGLEPFRVVGADLADVPLVLRRIAAAVERAANSATPRTWMLQANPRPVS